MMQASEASDDAAAAPSSGPVGAAPWSLRRWALPVALALGVLADLLLLEAGRPGLNVALFALAGAAALFWLRRRRGDPEIAETRWLLGGALLCAISLLLRDAEALAVLSLLAAVLLLGLAAGRASNAWATRARPGELLFAAARVALLCAAGPLGWGRAAPAPPAGRARWRQPARTLVRGSLLALPVLPVLAALLMAADPMFELLVERALLIDVTPLIDDLLFTAVIAWLVAGYLRAFLVDDAAATDWLQLPRPAVTTAEVCVALWLLNLLFAAFIAVQLRYLFGGASLVELTAGLSYADYARRGFFELVATAALVLPVLLLADWAAAPGTPLARRTLSATMLLLVVLLLGVIASAAYRMWLYQDAYGLTELRLYVSMFIVWLTAVLVWLVRTVLRGERERFVFGGVLAGLACLGALYLLNPHALIARVNLDRAERGAAYDGEYLRSLSADAVPTLIERLDRLPAAERCRLRLVLETRWAGARVGGWRSWNLADADARRRVRALAPAGSVDCVH